MPPRPVHFDVSSYAPGTRHRPHAHDELHISLVLRGSVRERVGGVLEHGAPLSVVVKDPCVTHEDEFGDTGALMVRLCLFGREIADIIDDARRATSWRWTHDAAVARPFLRIAERLRRGPLSLTTADDDVTDLLAAISARAAATAGGEPPAWLRDAVTLIQDGWRPGLGVHDVARFAGVHPVYLARCVRRWYGVATGDLLRRERLRHAACGVAANASTVSGVAHDLHFSDEAHLCREFGQTLGVTPGRYRRLTRALDAKAAG